MNKLWLARDHYNKWWTIESGFLKKKNRYRVYKALHPFFYKDNGIRQKFRQSSDGKQTDMQTIRHGLD